MRGFFSEGFKAFIGHDDHTWFGMGEDGYRNAEGLNFFHHFGGVFAEIGYFYSVFCCIHKSYFNVTLLYHVERARSIRDLSKKRAG